MKNLPEFDDLQYLEPRYVNFSYSDSGILRFAYKDISINNADAGCCFPIAMPDRYIWVKDSKNKELGIIKSVNDIESKSREVLKNFLYKRYFMPNIQRVNKLTEEFGLWYFDAETDRGPKSFVVKYPRQNIINLGNRRLLIIDVDSNRYNVNDYTLLSAEVVLMLERLV